MFQGQEPAGQVPRGGASQSPFRGRGRGDRQARNGAAFSIHRDPGAGDITPGAAGILLISDSSFSCSPDLLISPFSILFVLNFVLLTFLLSGLVLQSSPGQNEPPVLPVVFPRPNSTSRY